MKKMHDCVIGILNRNFNSIAITLPALMKAVEADNELIEWAKNDPNYLLMLDMLPPGYTMKDYADLRKNTGLQHFRFCPECGACIDWGALRKL